MLHCKNQTHLLFMSQVHHHGFGFLLAPMQRTSEIPGVFTGAVLHQVACVLDPHWLVCKLSPATWQLHTSVPGHHHQLIADVSLDHPGVLLPG